MTDLALTTEQLELAEVARSFLIQHKAPTELRNRLEADADALPSYWDEIADLGWLGIHLPESYGGSGYGLSELAVVVAEFGRVLAGGPLLPTVVASAMIAAAGTGDQCHRWLPGLAAGTVKAAAGLGGSLHFDSDGAVRGDAGIIVGAGLADLLLLVAGDDVVLLASSDRAVQITLPKNLDLTRKAASVIVEGSRDAEVLPGARRTLVAFYRSLVAAEAAGAASACLDLTASYALARRQFGQPIATFQAVKHHCANMVLDTQQAAAVAWDAGRAAKDESSQFELAAATATATALPGFLRAAQTMMQVHGGIGYTWEHDAHLYLRRAHVLLLMTPAAAAADEVTKLSSAGIVRRGALELPAEAGHYREAARKVAEEVAKLDRTARRTKLIETGYIMPHWPAPWGRGAGPLEQIVIDEEFARAGARRTQYAVSGWVALTLIQHGTEDQIQRWVNPTLNKELIWCQLFSEPEAGSDAAAVRAKAERTEGGWRVTGQKIWTTRAHLSHYGLATVRTDSSAPKRLGITVMAIDMRSPQVTVRPLREATGDALFNEVFLDGVFVPDSDVVGAVNDGWSVARATFGNERVSIGSTSYTRGYELVDLYRRHARSDPVLARRVGELLARRNSLDALRAYSVQRSILEGDSDGQANVSKLLLAELTQDETALALELLGDRGAVIDGEAADVTWSLLFSRCVTIGGGTSEIARNQIAERLLNFPREPFVE
jgi:alkylation response protein AidB-like acyl-CoA dehydrogenase